MAEDDVAKGGSGRPAVNTTAPAAALGESAQELPPVQSLPPAQSFSSRPPESSGTAPSWSAPSQAGQAAGPPAGYGMPTGYGPPGYPPLGNVVPPPGYAPPGYPPATWPVAGWNPGWFTPLPPSPFGPGYAPGAIGLRIGALLIDGAMVFVSMLLVDLLIVLVDGPGKDPTPAAMAITLLWVFFVLSYHPASWYVFDCTLGQRALGLRVRRRSDGQSLGFGAVNIRYVIFCVETLVFPLGIIAAAMAANDPMKRTWHDEAAGSVVVKRV